MGTNLVLTTVPVSFIIQFFFKKKVTTLELRLLFSIDTSSSSVPVTSCRFYSSGYLLCDNFEGDLVLYTSHLLGSSSTPNPTSPVTSSMSYRTFVVAVM